MDLGARVGVVVAGHDLEPVEFDGVQALRARLVEPPGPGEQRRRVAGGEETQAQREGRKRVSGIRSGDHGDAHAGYPATASDTRLTRYDRSSAPNTLLPIADSAGTVQAFLNALAR